MSGGFGGNPSDNWSDNDLGFPQQYLPLYQQWLAHKNASGGNQPVDPAAFIAAAAASGHVDTRTWAALGLGQVNLGSSVPSKEINFSTNDSARNFGAQQSDTPLTWRRGQEPTLGSLKSQLEKAASGIPLKPSLKKPDFKAPRKPSESLAKKWDSSDRGELKMDMKQLPLRMTHAMEKHPSSLTAQMQMAKPPPTVSSQAYSPAVGGSFSAAPFNPWPSSAVSASSIHLDGSSCQEVFFVLPVQVESISTDAHLQPSHTGTRISMALWEKVKTPLMPCKDDAMAQAVQAAFPVRVRGKTNLTVNIEGVTIVITNAMVFEGQTPVEALVLGIDIMLAAGLIWDVATSQICALAGRVPPRQMLNNERLIGCPATKEMLTMQQPPSSHSTYQEPWKSTAQQSGENSWPSQKGQSRRDHSPDSWGDSSFSSSRKDSWHDRHRDFSPGPPGRRDRRSPPITRQDRSPPPKSRQDRSPIHIGRRDRSPLSIGRRDRSPLSIGRRDRSPLSIGRRDRSRSPLSIGRRDRSPLSLSRRDRSPISNTRRGRSPVPSRQDRSPLPRRARSPLPSSRRDRSPLPSSRRERSPLPSGRRDQSPLSNSRRDRSPPTNRARSSTSRGYSPTTERQNYKRNNQRQSPKRTTDNPKTFQKTKSHANRKDGNSSLSQKDSSSSSKNQKNTSTGSKANSNQKQSSNSSDKKNSSSSAAPKADSIVTPKVNFVSESKTESSSVSKPRYTNQRNTSSRYGGANLKSVVNEEKDEKSSNVTKPAGPDINTSSNAGLGNDDPVVKSGEVEQQSETDNTASQGDQPADSKLGQIKTSQTTGKQISPGFGKKAGAGNLKKKTIVRRKTVTPPASVHKCKKRLTVGASQKPIGRGKQVVVSGKTKIIRKVPARTAKKQTEDGDEPGSTQSTENQQEATQEPKEDSGVDDIVLELSSDIDDSGTGTVTEAGGELELEDISASEGEDEEKKVEQELEDVSSVSNSEMLDDVSDTELPNSDNEQKDSFSGTADQEDEMMEQVTDNEDEDYVEDAVAEEEPGEDEDATEHLAAEEEGNVEAEEAVEDGAEEEANVEAEEAIEDGPEEEGNLEAEEAIEDAGEEAIEDAGEDAAEEAIEDAAEEAIEDAAEEEGNLETEETLDEEQPTVEQVGDANEQEDEEPLMMPESDDADEHPEYDGGIDETKPAEDIPEQNEATVVEEDEQVVAEPSADEKGECVTKSETEPAENVDSTAAQPDNRETEHVDEAPKKPTKTVKKVTPKKVIKKIVKTRSANTNATPVTKRVIRTRRVVVKKK